MLKERKYKAFCMLSSKKAPASKHITSGELKALRRIEDKWAADWLNPLTKLKQALSVLFFVPNAGVSHNMCKNYGHVVREFGFKTRPRCDDCGQVITENSPIRGSSLIEARTAKA
jgi:hypothetical protein